MRTGIISWIDVKLGVRMLFKSPGLTLVGGLAMALAIGIGAGTFSFGYAFMVPRLPLDEGHRIVALQNQDIRLHDPSRRSLHDFADWRQELRSVREVSAYRDVERNLIARDGAIEPVRLAEMSASGFRVARVAPALGRPLLDEDERADAPPVVVIGHDAWRTRFGADPSVVGRTVRLGNAVHTVVGVMPRGFAFPVNHGYWVPLRLTPADYPRGEGPQLLVFGRLAPGASRAQAQAELDAVGRRTAAAHPRTHADLRPQVLDYTQPVLGNADVTVWELGLMQGLISLLLLVVAVNVAVLVYARTATRRGEIAIRTALGASRRRIVAQLFTEALVLAAVAAAAGLLLARAGLAMVVGIQEMGGGRELPFWLDFGLRPATVLYVVGLTVLAAVIAGVLPALGATGRRVQDSLRQMGGGSGLQLGRTWTVLIVTQVAFAVAAIPVAVGVSAGILGEEMTRPLFPPDEFLTAQLVMDPEPPAGIDARTYERELAGRFVRVQQEVERRLEAEPWVAGVAAGTELPEQGGWIRIQVDGVPQKEGSLGTFVTVNHVDGDYLAAFGSTVLAGRRLGPADVDTAARAVVVNQAFVRKFLKDGNVLGRRVRYGGADAPAPGQPAPAPEPWLEIVGVVADVHANDLEPGMTEAGIFRPLVPGQFSQATLALRLRGDNLPAYQDRLRAVAAEVDPTLRVTPQPLGDVYRRQAWTIRMPALVMGLIILSVVGLSAAGIYALMSFTVTQRRREIGIRAALGADPRRILASVFNRSLRQLGLGLALGLAAAVVLNLAMGGEVFAGLRLLLLPAVCLLMTGVGLLAALGPARRGLRIQPMEALREE